MKTRLKQEFYQIQDFPGTVVTLELVGPMLKAVKRAAGFTVKSIENPMSLFTFFSSGKPGDSFQYLPLRTISGNSLLSNRNNGKFEECQCGKFSHCSYLQQRYDMWCNFPNMVEKFSDGHFYDVNSGVTEKLHSQKPFSL